MWEVGDIIRIDLDIENRYTIIKEKKYNKDSDEIILCTDLGEFNSEYCYNLEGR